jgi:predicted nucleotidyltransferase
MLVVMLHEAIESIVSENRFIAGIIVFGSTARGESSERSDLDLLILWENLNVNPSKRHIHIYKAISKHLPAEKLTVVDMEYTRFLNIKKATPLLLNIIWDGVAVYDKYGRLEDFMLKVRRELESKGVVRRKDGKHYYWELPKPGCKIKLEV